MFAWAKLREEIEELLPGAVLAIEQADAFGGFIACEDFCAGFDPIAAEIAPGIARRDTDARVIADALHFARVADCVDVKRRRGVGRGIRRGCGKPNGSAHSHAIFAERFKGEVFLAVERLEGIRCAHA